jgi:hypothetical protein
VGHAGSSRVGGGWMAGHHQDACDSHTGQQPAAAAAAAHEQEHLEWGAAAGCASILSMRSVRHAGAGFIIIGTMVRRRVAT